MDKKYIAFISYRHAELDSAVAKKLHSLIEQYRIPKGLRKDGQQRLGIVFRDQEELNAASNLTEEIQHALDHTEYLIVICSKNAIVSPWVAREIDYFLQHHDHEHILTVLASGEPAEVFPRQLTQPPEGQDAPPIEPLAVDVRADTVAGSCRKLRREVPRLIATLLQCPYDALVMREQKRKNRRIIGVTAGIMAILLGFTSMVLLKNRQIAQVNTQLEFKNEELDQANTDLNQANISLEEQKAAVQLRESQLLAQDAAADLENADYLGAIEKALAALPQNEQDNRPYYAPAERVLMEATNVFQPDASAEALNALELVQLTDVADFSISQDSTRVVSVDRFGTVCCFDSDNGTLLWNQHAAPDGSSGSMTNLHIFLAGDDTVAIRSTRRQLTAYDLQTGQQLWSVSFDEIAKGYLFYHADRNTLIVANAYHLDLFKVAYQLTEIHGQTGEILQNIPILTQDGNLLGNFSDSSSNELANAGVFSEDGTQFYGVCFDNHYHLQYYRADLTKGTAQVLYTHDEAFDYSSYIIGTDKKDSRIDVVIQDSRDDVLISALSIHAESGKLQWQTDVLPSLEIISFSPTPGSILFTQSNILIGCYDHYIYLDRQTGEHLQTILAPDQIMDITPVSDYTFGITLADGSYLLGWIQNDNTLKFSTDSWLNMGASITEPGVSKVWGGGILQLYTDNDSFTLGIGNFVSPGYVAIIPQNKENTIEIIRPKQAPSLLPYTAVTLPTSESMVSSQCVSTAVGSHLAIGPLHPRTTDDYYYFTLDPVTRNVVSSFSTQEHYYDDELYWNPDTLLPLICDYSGSIFCINEDGSQTQLYDPVADQEALAKEEGLSTSLSLFCCTSGYTDGSQTLLTAACTPKTLQIWRNGIFSKQISIPESLQISVEDRLSHEVLLQVGTNGWVLTGFYEFGNPISLKNIAAYHPDRDSWTILEGEDVFYNDGSLALAHTRDWLAFVTQDGTIKILDLQTGHIQTQFSTQIPFGSVLKMEFFLDDTCLAVKTSGGYLRIYDLTTGTQIYYDQFDDAYSSSLQIFEDPQNQRLYLKGGTRSSICLDQRSWTALGYSEHLLYYHENTDCVYMTGGSAPLSYSQIPSTGELVQLASDLLKQKTT